MGWVGITSGEKKEEIVKSERTAEIEDFDKVVQMTMVISPLGLSRQLGPRCSIVPTFAVSM